MQKQSIFLIIALLLSLTVCGNPGRNSNFNSGKEPGFTVQPGMTLVGRISDDAGCPINGIAVCDGYTRVKTDSNGIYQIRANRAATMVWISTPAEYEIPTKNGLAAFYTQLKNTEGIERHDFILKRCPKKCRFTLVMLADTHDQKIARLDKDMPLIAAYANTMPEPRYAIILGDLMQDVNFFSAYSTYLNQLQMPILTVIGNHDYDRTIHDNDLLADDIYEEYYGPRFWSHDIGDCHFIGLDNVHFEDESGTKSRYWGEVDELQLEWLRQDLQDVPKDKLIVLCSHIWMLQCRNYNKVFDMLKGYKVETLSGHSHSNKFRTVNKDIHMTKIASVMGINWDDIKICPDGSPRGFAVMTFDQNRVADFRFKPTHHNENYQIRLYKGNEQQDLVELDNKTGKPINNIPVFKEYANKIIVTIFACDTRGKVYAREDSSAWKDITSTIKTDYEPLAFRLTEGPYMPPTRGRVEPSKNKEIYTYTPESSTWKTIEIKYEDPFGKTYTANIDNSPKK